MSDNRDSEKNQHIASRERRVNPRYSFIATALLTEIKSATPLSGRISEISRDGCFIDTLIELPLGTRLRMQISCDRGQFTSFGKVAYVLARFGMGIVFVETSKDQVELLESWLADIHPSYRP